MAQHFLSCIQHLRTHEEVMLYGHLLQISKSELEDTANYLLQEYEQESLNYPFSRPPFSKDAAIWAAQLFFTAAQLMLYRAHKESDLEDLLSGYNAEITPSEILSADLTLRFIGPVIQHLKVIDPDDPLILPLEKQLQIWHYSGISYDLDLTGIDFSTVKSDSCLRQMYTDRLIAYKRQQLAEHPEWRPIVEAGLGIHTDIFWKNFNKQNTTPHGSD